eukprot:5169-Heterococcus_DN1.PRE.2
MMLKLLKSCSTMLLPSTHTVHHRRQAMHAAPRETLTVNYISHSSAAANNLRDTEWHSACCEL